MLRGLITGLLSGTALSGVVLVAASQLLPEVSLAPAAPQAGAAEVPAGSQFNAELPDEAPVIPNTESAAGTKDVPVLSEAPQVTPPQVDTAPAGAPEPGSVAAGLTAPSPGEAPQVSGGSAEAETVTRPAASVTEATGPDASPTRAPVPQLATGTTAPTAPSGEAGPSAPSVDTGEAAPNVAISGGDAPVNPGVDSAIASDDAPPQVPAPSTPAGPVASPEAELSPAPETDTEVALVPPSSFARPTVPGLSPLVDEAAPEALEEEPAEPEAPVEAGPAIKAWAAPFAPQGDAPRFSVVLIDEPGAEALALEDFPIPLAVAIDPLATDALIRMATLRALGVEVLVLTPLPDEAAPSDVEVAFAGFIDAVPEAVAVMDLPQAVLQGSRARSEQVVEIVAASGHGVLTYDSGLNALLQVAEGDGVPARSVTRVFDTGNSDDRRMRRFLDQGAFQAGQEGGAVLVGQLRAETLAVLTDWAQGNRAGTVQLAPVSAVLQRQ